MVGKFQVTKYFLKSRVLYLALYVSSLSALELRVMQEGDRFGFVNEKKEWVISPRFDGATEFVDGVASIWAGGLPGLIGTNGKIFSGLLHQEIQRMRSPVFIGCTCAPSVFALLNEIEIRSNL